MGFWLTVSNGNVGHAPAGELTIYSAWGGNGTRRSAPHLIRLGRRLQFVASAGTGIGHVDPAQAVMHRANRTIT